VLLLLGLAHTGHCTFAALRFPENANMHDIQAHADDGVLRLRIAKTADAKRDKTVVKVT
jgi:HSP20 family molecular chaperone IbpA